MIIAEKPEKLEQMPIVPQAAQPREAGNIEYASWFAPPAGELEYRSWLALR